MYGIFFMPILHPVLFFLFFLCLLNLLKQKVWGNYLIEWIGCAWVIHASYLNDSFQSRGYSTRRY